MKKIIPLILLVAVAAAGCETMGDKTKKDGLLQLSVFDNHFS
jgi:hypothetical protein